MMILGHDDNLRHALMMVAEKNLRIQIASDGKRWFVSLIQNDLNKPGYGQAIKIGRDEDLSFALHEVTRG